MIERQKIKSDISTADPVPILNNFNEYDNQDIAIAMSPSCADPVLGFYCKSHR